MNTTDPFRDMLNMQTLMDAWNREEQKKRSENQMTLGQLIDILSGMEDNAQVANLCNPHSYRGYYDDIAFTLGEGTRNASDLLYTCEKVMGRVLEGYKGGDYLMGETTPVWIANYGCTGEKLMKFYPEILCEEDK